MTETAGGSAGDTAACAAASGIADGTIKVEADDLKPRVELDIAAAIVNTDTAELDCSTELPANPPKKVKK
jgi:hypothetical protein